MKRGVGTATLLYPWRQAWESGTRISHWFCAVTVICFAPMLPAQIAAQPNDFSSSHASVVSNGESLQSDGPDAAADDTAGIDAVRPRGKTDWVNRWLQRVDKTRLEQPHTVAPLITTHVLLVQQFRFDSFYQQAPAGTWTFGGGKGVEIIPNGRMEVQVGIPPYFVHKSPSIPDGFGDVSIFVKFRALSAPEGKGNYFLGFFLGGSFPAAAPPNGIGHAVWSPMIAAAKGWGFFDVQSTLSASLPQSGTNVLGRQILFNDAFQFKVAKIFWPQIETNSTFFVDGPHSGKQQTFLTPGLVVGSFKIFQRLRFAPGIGVQIAATHFHLYDHRWIWSLRFPF